MIYITGDTHGDISFFRNPKLNKLTEKDYLIVCGDFGFIWDPKNENEKKNKNRNSYDFCNCYTDVSLWKPICFSKSMCTKGNVMAEHGNSR